VQDEDGQNMNIKLQVYTYLNGGGECWALESDMHCVHGNCHAIYHFVDETVLCTSI
jgi:hypothetical protein